MVTKQTKAEIIAGLVEKLNRATAVYVVDYSRMTVAETNNFRRALREKEFEYKVAKNTLIERALEEVEGKDIPFKLLFGQSGVVFSYGDPIAPAKVIKEFFDKGEKPRLKAALIEGQLFDGADIKKIASLPSRADLVAGILGSLNSPASGIVGAISAVMRDLAYVIEEVAKKQNAA